MVSNKYVNLDLKNSNNPIIKLRTLAAPKIQNFNLLLYDNKFKDKLLYNWEIEVTSVIGEDVNIKMGSSTAISLS